METLGWFLYEVSDLDGDHASAIDKLLKLNPTFQSKREDLFQAVLAILNVELPSPVTDCSDADATTKVAERKTEDELANEDSVEFQFPNDGVIKIFNEPNFKLGICSNHVSQKFLAYAKERNCPVEILDTITKENLLGLEARSRQIQEFWR